MPDIFTRTEARVLCLSGILLLAGCGGHETSRPETTAAAESQQAEAKAAVPPSSQKTGNKKKSSSVFPDTKRSGKEVRAQIQQSHLLIRTGQVEEAHAKLNQLIQSPDIGIEELASAHGIRALVFLKRRDLGAAVADLNLAILLSKGKQQESLQSLRGAILGAAWQSDENVFLLIMSLADHRRSPEVNPRLFQSIVSAEESLTVADLNAAFVPAVPKAVQPQSTTPPAKQNDQVQNDQVKAGFQKLLAQQYEAAAEELTGVLEQHPENTRALVGRAVAVACAAGDLQQVKADLQQALSLAPDLTVADDLLHYLQFALPNDAVPLPPSQEKQLAALTELARQCGFPDEKAEKAAHEIDFIKNQWGTASPQQREVHVFAGLAHLDPSPELKQVMLLLVELADQEERMRIRQRYELVISQLKQIGLNDPRSSSRYADLSTTELLETVKSLRWDRSPRELKAIGRVLRRRPQQDIDRVVAAWGENARKMNPTLAMGPPLHQHLTLMQVVSELGPNSVPALIRLLQAPEIAHIRESIVALLSVHEDRRCIEPLKQALQDGHGKASFRRRAELLLKSFQVPVPASPVDPLVLKTINQIVVSDPHQANYLEFSRYEQGLVEAGEAVVAPLTDKIQSMLVPADQVGVRLHDIGGTPARVLLGIASDKSGRKRVEASLDAFLDSLASDNDQVALETKWYILCVLSELTDSLQKNRYRSHALRKSLSSRSAALGQSVKHLGPVSPQSLAVKTRIQNMLKDWQSWQTVPDPLKTSADPFQ